MCSCSYFFARGKWLEGGGEFDFRHELFQWPGRACIASDINTAQYNNLNQDNSTVYNTCRNKFMTATSIVYFLCNKDHCYPSPAYVRSDFFREKKHNISRDFLQSHPRTTNFPTGKVLNQFPHICEVGGVRLLGKYTKKFLAFPGMI